MITYVDMNGAPVTGQKVVPRVACPTRTLFGDATGVPTTPSAGVTNAKMTGKDSRRPKDHFVLGTPVTGSNRTCATTTNTVDISSFFRKVVHTSVTNSCIVGRLITSHETGCQLVPFIRG